MRSIWRTAAAALLACILAAGCAAPTQQSSSGESGITVFGTIDAGVSTVRSH